MTWPDRAWPVLTRPGPAWLIEASPVRSSHPTRWEFGGAWLPFVRQVIRRRNLAEAG